MDEGRPKNNDFPPYMTVDGDRGGFVVRNPANGKKKRFSVDKETEARAIATTLSKWVDKERQAEALDAGRPTVAGLVDLWRQIRLPYMPWDTKTRKDREFQFARIRRELGLRVIKRTDCMDLETWLAGFCRGTDSWNDWRYVLVLLWKVAVARKLADANEAEKILPRSTSKKLESNRKMRGQLDVPGFKAIHDKAPGWLQIAMEQSLVTLQARSEICNMRHTHYRNGHLFVIRDKVSGDSDMAFIRIALTEQLEEIRRRSLSVDSVLSPYLVRRAPDRRRREWTDDKPHWTYVKPEYLSKAFAAARDACGLFAKLNPAERPTFHEIRGLGSRIYEAAGVSRTAIQALMTHAHKRTTEIYLDRGAAALTDSDYVTVAAPLTLSEMLR